MDKEHRKGKKLVIVLFLSCLCIALACFGIFACVLFTKRREGFVDDWIVDISKIVVLIGVFFLVLAFGYLFPILLNKRGLNASEIFDETNMRQALGKYIPNGETLLAGIHAVSKEMSVRGVFGKCVCTESGLTRNENGGIIALNKKKYSSYDVYLGITQSSLIITQCKRNDYFYQFDDTPDVSEADVQEVTSDVFFVDIGTCFPLTDIQSCEIKNGWMGSAKCFITMKNGSYFKLMFPKLGGLGVGMPHHTEYCEAILARLGGINA